MRRVPVAVVLLAALVLGGCGIPAKSGVRVLGAGPSAGPAQDNDTTPPDPVSRGSTRDYRAFVSNYLEASAGDWEGWKDRVTKFMTPALRKTFKPTRPGVVVVRPIADPLYTPGESNVSVDVQDIGQLDNTGTLVPSSDPNPRPHTLNFQVELHDDGLYLSGAPSYMLLSAKGLETYYLRRTIYFWNSGNTGLVPDVRYMPVNVPTAQQPTMVLNWLVGGPAEWLHDAAAGFPANTTAPENIPAISNDRLQIKLSDQAVPPGDKAGLDRLSQQLFWSLRPLQPATLEIKIGHRDPVTYSSGNYLGSNASYWLHDQPDKFVVYNGVIHRLTDSAHDADAVPVLKQAANKGIQSAALSDAGQHSFAAVVAGSGASSALRVAVAPIGAEADLKTVRGLKAPLGAPAWAISAAGDTDAALGLITSQNRLFSFGSGGAGAQPVEWQDVDPGPITAFAVAPDGLRIALVAGGKLYRGVLVAGGSGVAISGLAQLRPPGLESLSSVAWSSEGYLVVSGVQAKRVSIDDISIDAARLVPRLSDIGTDPVTYLTAYPINPVTHFQSLEAPVAYVAHGDAWNAVGYPARITAAQVAGPIAGPTGAGATPTAPFYLN